MKDMKELLEALGVLLVIFLFSMGLTVVFIFFSKYIDTLIQEHSNENPNIRPHPMAYSFERNAK